MPRYVSDKDFPKDRNNRMVPMKDGKIYSPIFPNEGDLNVNMIQQSAPATCWIVGTLRSLAMNNPNMIRNLFTDNGDGTVTIHLNRDHFIDGDITIDKTLPATDSKSPDWVRLLEKGLAASELYVGNKMHHPRISMDNLNWGHVELFLSMIDSDYANSNPNVSGILAESKDKDELIIRFTEFCNEVTENQGSVMIQTEKHNMPVTKIEDGFIYYVEQLTGESHRITINSLFDGTSGMESLLFSLQGKDVISIRPQIPIKEVLKAVTVWHNTDTDNISEKIRLDLVRDSVKDILNTICFSYKTNYNCDIDMFYPNYSVRSFLENDDVMKKFFKESQSQNYAEFHEKLRKNLHMRQYIADAYFNYLLDNVEKLPLEKHGLTIDGVKNTLQLWKNENWNNAQHVQKKAEYVEDFKNLRIYKTKKDCNNQWQLTDKKIRDQEAIRRADGERIVQSKANVETLHTLYRTAKKYSSSFNNSDNWINFRHSLHITSCIANALDQAMISTKKTINYREGMDELLKNQLEHTTASIDKLGSTVAGYVNNYCKEHRIEEAKDGKITYAHLCEILSTSWMETRLDAKRYKEYKLKKFEPGPEFREPVQNNAQNKTRVVTKAPNKDDLNKLKLVGTVLNEKIEIPGYAPAKEKKTENPVLNAGPVPR